MKMIIEIQVACHPDTLRLHYPDIAKLIENYLQNQAYDAVEYKVQLLRLQHDNEPRSAAGSLD